MPTTVTDFMYQAVQVRDLSGSSEPDLSSNVVGDIITDGNLTFELIALDHNMLETEWNEFMEIGLSTTINL